MHHWRCARLIEHHVFWSQRPPRKLAAAHGFTLGVERVKVAINNEFASWDRPLAANDTVVFIPPVAGG